MLSRPPCGFVPLAFQSHSFFNVLANNVAPRRQVVCPECSAIEPLGRANIAALKAKQTLRCKRCGQADMRFKVMLYGDDEVRGGWCFFLKLLNYSTMD